MGQLADGRMFDMGYIIFDTNSSFAQLHTLAANRAKAWHAMFGRRLSRKEREEWQAKGFRCVFVIVEQSSTKV